MFLKMGRLFFSSALSLLHLMSVITLKWGYLIIPEIFQLGLIENLSLLSLCLGITPDGKPFELISVEQVCPSLGRPRNLFIGRYSKYEEG